MGGIIFSVIMQILLIGAGYVLYPIDNRLGPFFVAFILATPAYWLGLLIISVQQRSRRLTISDRFFLWWGYLLLCLVTLFIVDLRRRAMYGVGVFG